MELNDVLTTELIQAGCSVCLNQQSYLTLRIKGLPVAGMPWSVSAAPQLQETATRILKRMEYYRRAKEEPTCPS